MRHQHHSIDHASRIAYSVSEIVAITGLSRSTVYRMFEDKRLRGIRIRGRRLIARSELERLGLLETREVADLDSGRVP